MGAKALTAATMVADHAGRWGTLAPKPLFLGLCGSQGCGKSTVAEQCVEILTRSGVRAVAMSLDDFYLRPDERRRLAREAHPLLATRGPPGTHDVGLARETLAALRAGEPVRLPRFDKLSDDRSPEAEWRSVQGRVDVAILEGWCVGASPQPSEALIEPVNALERDEDARAVWRTTVNDALADPYAALFGRLDRLVMLKAPNFEVVQRWRLQQEEANAADADPARQARAMDEAQVARFIQHYERLTRWMLAELPARADLVIALDEDRRVVGEVERA